MLRNIHLNFVFALLVATFSMVTSEAGENLDQSASCPGCQVQRLADAAARLEQDSQSSLDVLNRVRTELILEDILAKLGMAKRPKKRRHIPNLPKSIIDRVINDQPNPSDSFIDGDSLEGYKQSWQDETYRQGNSRTDQFFGTANQVYVMSKGS